MISFMGYGYWLVEFSTGVFALVIRGLKEGCNGNRKFSCFRCKMNEFFVDYKQFDKQIPTTF